MDRRDGTITPCVVSRSLILRGSQCAALECYLDVFGSMLNRNHSLILSTLPEK